MPNKSSHVRGASVKTLAKRKKEIQAIADDVDIVLQKQKEYITLL